MKQKQKIDVSNAVMLSLGSWNVNSLIRPSGLMILSEVFGYFV